MFECFYQIKWITCLLWLLAACLLDALRRCPRRCPIGGSLPQIQGRVGTARSHGQGRTWRGLTHKIHKLNAIRMFYSLKLTCGLSSSVDLHDQVHLDAAVALRKRLSPANKKGLFFIIYLFILRQLNLKWYGSSLPGPFLESFTGRENTT